MANDTSIATVILRLKEEGSEAAARLAAQVEEVDTAFQGAKRSVENARNELDEAARATERAGNAAEEAARDATRFAGAFDRMGDRAGAVGSSFAKTAGAIALVSPAAAEGSRAVADIADVFEVAAVAGKGLGISMAGMISILGPVAVAVGALALAWKLVSEEAARAEAKQSAAASSAERAAKASERIKDSQRSLQDQADLLAKKVTETDLAARDAAAATAAAYDDQIAMQREALALAEQEARAQQTKLKLADGSDYKGFGVAAGMSASETVEAAAALEAAQQRKAAAAAALAGTTGRRDAESEKARDLTYALAKAQEEEAAATGRAAAASGRKAEQLRELVVQEKSAADAATARHQAALAMYDAAETAEQGLARLAAAGDPIAEARLKYEETTAAVGRYAAALHDAGRSEEAAVLTAQALAAAHNQLTATTAEATAATDASATGVPTTTSTDAGSVANQAVGAVVDPLGAVAAAHPIAAAIVSALQAAAGNGDPVGDAADLVIKALGSADEFIGRAADAAVRVVREAPGALVAALPDIVAGLAEVPAALAEGLAEAVPEAMVALAEALPALAPELLSLIAMGIVGMPLLFVLGLLEALSDGTFAERMGEAFTSGIERMWERLEALIEQWVGKIAPEGGAVDSAGDWVSQAGKDFESWWNRTFVGSYASGNDGFDRDGIARVHAGERVVNSTGASSGRTTQMQGRGGGQPSISIGNGLLIGTVDEVVRAVRRELGPNGRRLAWG